MRFSTASFTTPIASTWPVRACASADHRHESMGATNAAWRPPRRDKAVDNDGLRHGALESALRPSLPTATRSGPHAPNLLLILRAQIHVRLTNPAKQNIITSIRGSRRQVADIKSEPRPASNRNRWPASYWNAWPASSESAGWGRGNRFSRRGPENNANNPLRD